MMNILKKTAVLLVVLLLIAAVSPAVLAVERKILDTTRLESLMEVAERLDKTNYTADTWKALDDAMTEANTALSGSSQYSVDAAAGKMTKALSGMVLMDFSALNTAMAAADAWADAQPGVDALWDRLLNLVEQEQAARVEGDQAKVDSVAAELTETLDQLKAATENSGTGSTPWIILFAVSLLFNAALVVLMLMKTRNVKKCQKDDVPLVEYDIDDDMV